MNVMFRDSGKFRNVFEIDLVKKLQRLLIAAAMYVRCHDFSNFGHVFDIEPFQKNSSPDNGCLDGCFASLFNQYQANLCWKKTRESGNALSGAIMSNIHPLVTV